MIRFAREGGETWSYARLRAKAEEVTAGLIRAGVGPGERIAILAEPSAEWIVAGLAILRAGAVLVPVDVQVSDRDLDRILADSGARRLFSASGVVRRIEHLNRAGDLDIFLLDGSGEEAGGRGIWSMPSGKEGASPSSGSASDGGILFYTSGTTGPPKGVPLTHENIVFQIEAVEQTKLIREGDRLLLPLPLHHVYPLVIGLLTPLALGVPVILPHALTGDGIVRALNEGKATLILGVPRLYRALFEGVLAKAGAAGQSGARLFSAALALARTANRIGVPLGRLLFRPVRRKMGSRVRLLASGGSPLDTDLAENLEALGWPVAVGYGLTETSPLLTVKLPGEGSFSSVGRTIPGVEIRIDSREDAKDEEKRTRENDLGEVLARGGGVFGGYRNLPDKTKEAFRGDWFRTGDLGYLDEGGNLYLRGRASAMVVLEGGENINPEELEEIYGACDEVEEIGVLEDGGKLAALVVPSRQILRERDPEEIQKRVSIGLRKRATGMPSYKRLSHLEITRQSLPTTRLGKMQRHLLAKRYAAAKAGEEGNRRAIGPVPIEELSSQDRVLLEEPRAKKLWELLGERYADRRVSPETNLELDLGIDSLEWVELSLSAQRRLGTSIGEETIDRVDTVRDLLGAVAGLRAGDAAGEKRPIEEPEEVLSETDRQWADPRGPWLRVIATVLFGFLRVLIGLRCRIKACGLENLPRGGPVLLVPNHVSFLDAPALSIALGLERAKGCFWAGRSEILFRGYFWRVLSRLCQVVPIDPRRGPLSSLAVGALVLKRRHPLVWFPEGSISRDGKMQKFLPGIGLIVQHYQPAIIPVFLDGAREVMPMGRTIPRAGEVVVHFGCSIDGRRLKAESERNREERAHEWIAAQLQEAVRRLGESVQGEKEHHRDAA